MPATNMEKPPLASTVSTTNSESDQDRSRPRPRRLYSGCVACLVFLGLAALYLAISSLFSMSSVSTNTSSQSFPHVPNIPITVALSPLPSLPHVATALHGPSFRLNVTLTNTSPSPIVILKWWSPFENIAAAMGIFKVTDLRWGTEVKCVGVMVDYLLPEDDTFVLKDGEDASGDLQRIGAGESVSQELEIENPEVEVKAGRRYSVKAEGGWMAVWIGGSKDGRYSMREALLDGKFESEAVEVQT